MKIAIVGGVAGGASAAARARRLDENAEIVLIERGAEPSFANCGLPYYVGGQIETRGKLIVAPEEMLVQRHRLDVRTRQTVLEIDRPNKRISVLPIGTTEPYWEIYDKLILAPGAAPLRPPIPGVDLPHVHTLRNLADADRLLALATTGSPRAVIIGAGFIGLEMAENLVHRGVATTVVELASQILPPWDPEIVAPLADHMVEKGVELILGDAAAEFVAHAGDNGTQPLEVRLQSGRVLTADFVLLCVGVRPENQLAVDAGLEVGPRGGILVNDHMQTSDPDIYAVGDAVQVVDFVTGAPIQIPLAGPANRQGRIAADHIFGRASRYRGTQGTAVVGVFDLAAAMTGQSEKALVRAGRDYATALIHPSHHASYYPGAEIMTLKLVFDPEDGRILGAQASGGAGIDKRIDVLAVAIQAGMTVYDLEEVELAYAPQFGSAKDPINMIGFVASGMLRGDHPQVHAQHLAGSDAQELQIIDVRTPAEFANGAIEGAKNIPLEELRARLGEVDPTRPTAVYCQVGQRGYMATRLLMHHKIPVRNISGGYRSHLQHQRATDLARK